MNALLWRAGRLTSIVAIMLLALVAPASAVSAPPAGGQELLRISFEPGESRTFVLTPTPNLSKAYWGIVQVANNPPHGLHSLWVAGTAYPSGNASGLYPHYPNDTIGNASVALPELAGFYSARISFSYICPARGAADGDSFIFAYEGPLDTYRHTLPNATAWTRKTYDLSTAAGGSISRAAVNVVFRFADSIESGGVVGGDPLGPTIDDFSVTGYKYGPVRELDVARTGTSVELSWTKPARTPAAPDADERVLGYRVWRRVLGQTDWSELTQARQAGTSLIDESAVDDVSYEYAVQAWDLEANGQGYGQVATAEALANSLAVPPTVSSDLANGAVYSQVARVMITATAGGNPVQSISYRLDDGEVVTVGGSSFRLEVVASSTPSRSISFWANDTKGTPSARVARSFTVYSAHPTALSISSPSTSAYRNTRVAGRLTDTANPTKPIALSGKPILVEYSYDKVTWKTLTSSVTWKTDSKGPLWECYDKTYSTKRIYYRASFAGTSGYLAAASPVDTTLPSVKLTRVTSWGDLARNKTYYARGYIEPKHNPTDSNEVVIRAYKQNRSGSYPKASSPTKTFSYKARYFWSTKASKTAYEVPVKFTSSLQKGKWKLVAYHATDSTNYQTFGSADYVTVK